ncbi:hypothetical protein LOC54_09515 [Acetobacter sp. AN02]|uniref:hypothetical protein n=1 Tax=Acetobacter sp. AN02 TaxID=2894186 RepID=UPI00243435CF|nr:hypothetical protein [Acetobacter sp. AN02]MDG6095338.1 hypothetical protein [Acetobacter sp. AN02]
MAGAFPASAQTVSPSCDNNGFLSAQQAAESGQVRGDQPVHICGKVVSVAHRARKTRSGVHGYFYVSTGSGVSIRIVTNLDEMNTPPWPWVEKGDQVDVVGRYYYDSPRRQGIDWTHKGTGSRWGLPGYVIVNGTKYE